MVLSESPLNIHENEVITLNSNRLILYQVIDYPVLTPPTFRQTELGLAVLNIIIIEISTSYVLTSVASFNT